MRKTKRQFKLAGRYAHRGYHDKPHIPENSMAAFRRAIEYGLSSELDVHLLADGNLAVFHDNDLERETGVKGRIEEYDLSNLRKLRLEGTDEMIPALDEVLELYEDTGLSLLIELKTAGKNYKELTSAVIQKLDGYKGDYAVQSFDPRVLIEYRRQRPDVIRGQLSKNFYRSRDSLPYYHIVALTNLMLTNMAQPDFISYQFTDRSNRVLRMLVDNKGYKEASWTINSADAYRSAVMAGSVPIFEQITPEELEELTGLSGGSQE